MTFKKLYLFKKYRQNYQNHQKIKITTTTAFQVSINKNPGGEVHINGMGFKKLIQYLYGINSER